MATVQMHCIHPVKMNGRTPRLRAKQKRARAELLKPYRAKLRKMTAEQRKRKNAARKRIRDSWIES